MRCLRDLRAARTLCAWPQLGIGSTKRDTLLSARVVTLTVILRSPAAHWNTPATYSTMRRARLAFGNAGFRTREMGSGGVRLWGRESTVRDATAGYRWPRVPSTASGVYDIPRILWYPGILTV